MLLQILDRLENFDTLATEVATIIETAGFHKNQIICQSLNPDQEDWHTGIGSIEELEEKEERKYCHLNPKLKDTVLGNLILKYNAYRTRIMKMEGRRCYSVHNDPSKRLHIPIITNKQAWMVWPTHNECHHLRPPFVYSTDTRELHSFFNGSLEDRIHIVMCV